MKAKIFSRLLPVVIALALLGGCTPQAVRRTSAFFDSEVRQTVYGSAAQQAEERIQDLQTHNEKQLSDLYAKGEGKLDQPLVNLLAAALEIAEESSGSFTLCDPPLRNLWDFEKAKIPSSEELHSALQQIDSSFIRIQEDKTITLSDELSLTPYLNGLAAAQGVAVYREANQSGILSIGTTIGAFRHKGDDGWFKLGIRNPSDKSEEAMLASLNMRSGYAAGRNRNDGAFTAENQTFHPFLDAKTGYPVQTKTLSAVAVSEDALLVDLLAAACFYLSVDQAFTLAERQGAGLILTTEGRIVYVSKQLQGRFQNLSDWEVVYR